MRPMTAIPVEQDSVFGPTQCGVPNPFVPRLSQWPSRFHGPVFLYPQQSGATFVVRPFDAGWPLATPGSSCGCRGESGFGIAPDGIGGFADEHPYTLMAVIAGFGILALGLVVTR